MLNIFRNIPVSFSALLLAAAALSSCSDDNYPDPDTPQQEPGVKSYFAVRVTTVDSDRTKAGGEDYFEYTDGVEFEHALDYTSNSQNVVIFLDNDYKYAGYTPLEIDLDRYTPSDQVSVEAVYIGFMRAAFSDGINAIPEKGLMVLNAHDIISGLEELKKNPDAGIEDILGLVDSSSETRIAGRSGNYFTMTSTAYLRQADGGWEHSMVFDINKNNIFLTTHQAILAPAAEAVVERMASKFSLRLPGAVNGQGTSFLPDGGRAQVIVCHYTDGQPNYNNRRWTLSVVGWGISKYETENYYFKNILGEGSSKDSYPYTYGSDINSPGHPFFNGWNRPAYKRSHWAIDPHYEDGVYPVQYRPAVDNPSLEYYGMDGKKPSLGYLSFNQLSTDFSGLSSEAGAVSLYSNENTIPDTRGRGLWQHDFAASDVVIGAKIHISEVSETRDDYDLYRNRIGVFYPSATDFATYFITTVNNQLASQSSMTYRFYDWDNPGANPGVPVMREFKVDHDNYRLYYQGEPLTPEKMASLPRCAIPATIENGDGKVIPWVEGMYIARRDIDPDTYEEVGEVQRLNIATNDFKSLVYDWIGPFDHFNKGRMVYSVPVRHNAAEKDVTQQNYRPATGDYGVVRNHWYRLSVDAINSLGNPVDDPDQKIIPYEAGLENSLMMEIKVLDWHVFSTEVTLPSAP